MKKILVLLLVCALVFSLMSMTACRQQTDNNSNNNNQGNNNQGDNNQGDNNQGDNNQGDNNQGDNNQGDNNQGDNNQGDNNQDGGNSDDTPLVPDFDTTLDGFTNTPPVKVDSTDNRG